MRIPEANLAKSNFCNADFENADLSNVVFSQSNLNWSNFKNAKMEGVQFGTFPTLMCDDEIYCLDICNQKTLAAVGFLNGDI